MPAEPAESAPDSRAPFWRYVDDAEQAITARVADADAQATRLLMVLNRTSQALIADLESRFQRPAGLNWSQFRILQSLWVRAPMRAKDVAAVTGMSRALLSASLRPLAARGLVASAADPADGRAVLLSLTAAGRRLIGAVYAEQNVAESAVAAALTPADRSTLERLLRTLADGQPGAAHDTPR